MPRRLPGIVCELWPLGVQSRGLQQVWGLSLCGNCIRDRQSCCTGNCHVRAKPPMRLSSELSRVVFEASTDWLSRVGCCNACAHD